MARQMEAGVHFKPGNLVKARGREWVVLPETRSSLLKLRPLGGAEDDATLIYLPLEQDPPVPATFDLPGSEKPGSQEAALLLWHALRLKLRAGAGPFRSFGNLNFEPRTYQLVPLLMALKQETIRLLVADDVGIGKTIEAGLIARELVDRGEIERLAVICPPHLCEQWQKELSEKFSLEAQVIRPGTAARLERNLHADESVFEAHPYTVVSLDYIKSDKRRFDFLHTCPEFVIVDEAHTCVQSNTGNRHQRYDLIRSLAEGEPRRGMVFLTATPHSGDDTAFQNLLGLLEPRFSELAQMPEGKERNALREELAGHFVQRRRGDIAEWKEGTGFPMRESRETTYRLTGAWGDLFDKTLAYARGLVQRAASRTLLEQRMSYWAALALLGCISSSPAAASNALRTRLTAPDADTEAAKLEALDLAASESIFDEGVDGLLSANESVPAGTLDDFEKVAELQRLIEIADSLRGPHNDPKLSTLIHNIDGLVGTGFRPIIFCRYIATAHYVGEELKKAFLKWNLHVEVITGELTPGQREERVSALDRLDDSIKPIVVATDCLSEGINLQRSFNAMVHYDLTWNPTRHEQREGRVDRFGQTSEVVRALMLYGENNPVDDAVLRVILRKAEKIRKELGVAVPVPAGNSKIVETIMKAVLHEQTNDSRSKLRALDLGITESAAEKAWQTAKDKVSRTVFSQRRLKPEEVRYELDRSASVLGEKKEVAQFVQLATERLGAGLEGGDGYSRLPVMHMPIQLQERLENFGFQQATRIAFDYPVRRNTFYIHRAHPLVMTLADYIAEQSLTANGANVGARACAIFTNEVQLHTTLHLLRLRFQLQVDRREANGGQYHPLKSLLVEECIGVEVRGRAAPKLLTDTETCRLLKLKSGRNMSEGQKKQYVSRALGEIESLDVKFAEIARDRSETLRRDHRRIRDASDAKGLRYQVTPALPVDKIGVYVFIPMVDI